MIKPPASAQPSDRLLGIAGPALSKLKGLWFRWPNHAHPNDLCIIDELDPGLQQHCLQPPELAGHDVLAPFKARDGVGIDPGPFSQNLEVPAKAGAGHPHMGRRDHGAE